MKRWQRICVIMLVVALAGVVLGGLWYNSSRQRFLRDLDRIEEGMTISQVEDIMSGYMKGFGDKWQPLDPEGKLQLPHSITYRHSEAGM